MNQPRKLNDKNIRAQSKTFWMTMQTSAPILLGLVYFMHKQSLFDPVLPEMKNIFLGLCVVSIASAFFFLGYFKRLQNKIRDNLQLGMDNEPAELQRYFTFIVIGMALCDMSAIFGVNLYITTGEYYYSLFFIAVSFFLGFLYKPELN